MDRRFLITAMVCFLFSASTLRAEILGKTPPAAPSELLDVSEEAFGEVMGLEEKKAEPPKKVELPKPVATLPPPAPIASLPPPALPPTTAFNLPPPAPLKLPPTPLPVAPPPTLFSQTTTLPGAPAATAPTIATAASAPPVELGAIPLADEAKQADTAPNGSLLPTLSSEALARAALPPPALAPQPVAATAPTVAAPVAPVDEPKSPVSVSAFPDIARDRIVPLSTPMPPLPGVPDVAIILANGQFYPSRVKLKSGLETRLLFTSVQHRAAALVIERMDIQRWVATDPSLQFKTELERARHEINREVAVNRVTEVILEPKTGIYLFHDALSGASGELVVE